ncbi:MAG: choice-of-anchor D domain-containing protein [Bryobacteraceae bacterium]|nr:choice-of-anchor D domain-containing protein [Bryobacteraceae bacterium]
MPAPQSDNVRAWGSNENGQLGNGLDANNDDQPVPGQVLVLENVAAIRGGANHSIALKNDGTVWAWGNNYYGQLGNGTNVGSNVPVPVVGLAGIIAVSAGWNYNLALKNDGTVWAWGFNIAGQLGTGNTQDSPVPVAVVGLNGVVAIAAGGGHSLALKSDGTVWAWGSNYLGRLGIGAADGSVWIPVQVSGLKDVAGIAAGESHSLALKASGGVWAWGSNASGQLGNGSAGGSSSVPVAVANLSGVVAISAGGSHSLALKTDQTAWAWGDNQHGQLGNGDYAGTFATPVAVKNLAGLKAVAAGEQHSIAAKTDGTVWAWGENADGQLGNGKHTLSYVPAQVTNITGVAAIASGTRHSLALKANGGAWAWGLAASGQLGNGRSLNSAQPATVPGVANAVAVAASESCSLALRRDGTLWAWGGLHYYSSSCVPSAASMGVPAPAPGLNGVVAVSAGSEHRLVLKSDGTVWGWGKNYDGQLGDGSRTNRDTPIQVNGLGGVLAVSAGGVHSLALTKDGFVWAWGGNIWGQLGNGSTDYEIHVPAMVTALNGVVAIAAGARHSLALKSDGSVWAWGNNFSGEVGNESQTPYVAVPLAVNGLSGVLAIAAGGQHSLALKGDGSVWAWGSNTSGQLGDGSYTFSSDQPVAVAKISGAAIIAASLNQNLAATNDGTIWAWGEYDNNSIRTPTSVPGLSNVVALAAGSYHRLAIVGTGIPKVAITPASLAFGGQRVGTASSNRSLSVTNNGDSPLDIHRATPTGIHPGDFKVTADTCTGASLPPGGSCGINVRFAPIGPANRSGAVLITTNAPGAPHLVPLSGAGISGPAGVGVFLDGKWYLDINGNGVWEPSVDRALSFGFPGATQVTGDWSGEGKKKLGVFYEGFWYLDYNGNGIWDGFATDRGYAFGWSGVTPLVGDWNGDGKTEIGVFKDGAWYLDFNGNGAWDGISIDRAFSFGWPGVTPLVGDWNGDGKTEIGVFNDGAWYLDFNGNGVWDGIPIDKAFSFGWPGVTPLVGDWNGNGKTEVAVFKDAAWYLDLNGNGVWEVSVDRYSSFGWPGVTPLAGDWNGDGKTEIGVFWQGAWYLDHNGNGWWDGPVIDRGFGFGWPGVQPVVGNW